MKYFTNTLILFLLCGVCFAQNETSLYRPGEILVQLTKGSEINDFLQEYNSNRSASTIGLVKPIHKNSNIFLLGFDKELNRDEEILNKVKNHEKIQVANFNYFTYDRSTEPNDPIFEDQWHLEIIQAPEAWDITTGGLTPQGDTIVVAVLDGGCQLDHDDLKNNIWRNWAEIPNDGIDNDGNGYIDDHFGLNTLSGNDNHPVQGHGTSVTGIIGAEGNNDTGLTGINWNVKLMILSKVNTEAEVVEAYMYAYEQRKKYIATNGAEGAFVVATNYSLGIDFTPCTSFELWNGAMDTLGCAGILNAGAVANQNVDIDAVGDVPGSCQSEFLITATNTNSSDEKVLAAGFGSINVDLGAPGTGSLTTTTNTQYGTFAGTSAATPHVAGAVALLYSVPCSGLTTMAKNQPKEAARRIKEFLLEGTDPIPSLEGKSVSGGRLNIFNSIELMQEAFAEARGELQIVRLSPNPVKGVLYIDYKTPDFSDYDIQIFNTAGQLVIHEVLPSVCGLSPYPMNISLLSSGTHFVRIYDGTDYVVEKFVVYR